MRADAEPAPLAVIAPEEPLLGPRTAAELRRGYTQIDEVLDVRQQARFRVLDERVERRTLELLMRARRNRLQQR